jgi:hypothetical protein
VTIRDLDQWEGGEMSRWTRLEIGFWAASAVALFPVSAMASTLGQQQMLMIESTVASVCTSVSTNGHVVNASLEGNIKARLSVFVSKLLPADASLKASVSGTSWSGVAQNESGSVVEVNMMCREKVFEKLVALIARQPEDTKGRTVAPRTRSTHRPAYQVPPLHTASVLPSVTSGTQQAKIQTASAGARSAAKHGNFTAALSSWLTAAELGDPNAQFEVGQIYDYGAHGVPPDCVLATQWYKAAAAHDLAAANYNVGGEYFYGCNGHFQADHVEALRWLRKAADEGSPDAQYEIGMIYYDGGAGVVPDRVLAKDWFTKAAQYGYPLAQKALRNFRPS